VHTVLVDLECAQCDELHDGDSKEETDDAALQDLTSLKKI
jgi:hypothetical protein